MGFLKKVKMSTPMRTDIPFLQIYQTPWITQTITAVIIVIVMVIVIVTVTVIVIAIVIIMESMIPINQ